MNVDTAINWIDRLLGSKTGKHLNDLQLFIIEQVWQGRKYLDIATDYHCTEGHVKDTAAALWQLLSQLLAERVTKTNLKSLLQRHAGSICLQQRYANASQPAQIVNYQLLGRERAIAKLDESIAQGQRTIVIQGEGGVGKTTLAQQYLKTCGCDRILELSMAKETAQIAPAAIIVEEWLRQDFQIEPGREFGIALQRLKRQLISHKIGILIDNLEPALDRDGRFILAHRNYIELLRVLTDRQLAGVTLITSRDRLCEVDLNLIHYRLSGLDLDAWQTYFEYRQIDLAGVDLFPLHQAYGGNAKAMEIIAGNICTDLDGDLATYLQSNRDTYAVEIGLKQSIVTQFDRLRSLDLDAYHLLCRAGCYRYRDIDRIAVEALRSLLWEIAPERQMLVITALKNRSLIEFQRGCYWLHPAIRAESISRLRTCPDWQQAHRQAAAYWLNSVTKIIDVDTAITGLEAYYHYLEIDDFVGAAGVLLQSRENQWGQFLPLASNLYRIGLIQPVLQAITQIIPHLPPARMAAELANILGDLYWIVGRVHEAIATQKQAIAATEHTLAQPELADRDIYCLQILNLDSLLSMGLYYIDLWELDRAQELFQQVIEIASNTAHDRWAQKAIVCLALVQSALNNTAAVRQLLTKIEPQIDTPTWTGSSAYFLQIIGQIYTNLGEYDRAHSIFQQTLTFCQTGNYLQTQGRTLTSWAQLYRLQGNLALAQTTHLQAIEILDRLGAKCDLAAAYDRAGLTWEQAGDLIQGRLYYLLAQQLFTEIGALEQLAKIEARIIY